MTEPDDTIEYTEEQRGDLRGLLMSNGKPYILIVLEDAESGGVGISHAGFDEDLDLAAALQEIALLVA